ncbi:MAG: hypothetical protein HOO67_06145 [Candidatus Peribacteraceae bacterium]|nr:hypothetical protein [Candidatus Peribacteraceae bacterium]
MQEAHGKWRFAEVAHIDRLLTDFSIEYANEEAAFVGLQVLPALQVKFESDKFLKYKKGNNFQLPDAKRAIRTKYKRISWETDTDSYKCEEYGLEDLIDDRERQNTDAPMDQDQDTTGTLTKAMLLLHETRVTSLVTSTANVTLNTTLSGTSQWSDYDDSDPFAAIETGIDAVQAATGMRPNTMVMGYAVWAKLKHHPDLLDRIKHTQKGVMTTDLLAALLGLDAVYVSRAVKNSAKEGQTVSLGYVWGKDALLYYRKPGRPTLRSLTFGVTFMSRDWQTERYREETAKSDVFRVSHVVDEKLVAADVAYLIKDAVA